MIDSPCSRRRIDLRLRGVRFALKVYVHCACCPIATNENIFERCPCLRSTANKSHQQAMHGTMHARSLDADKSPYLLVFTSMRIIAMYC